MERPLAYDVTTPNRALTEINDDASLAERFAQRVQACTDPLFDLDDGSQCEGSMKRFFFKIQMEMKRQEVCVTNLKITETIHTKAAGSTNVFVEMIFPSKKLGWGGGI